MTIGQRIKIARENRNMTQEEVATACKTTKQTIFKYENEIVTNIPYEKIVLLSEALSVSPSFLFGWEEKPPEEPELNEGEKLLIQLYRQVPPDRQRLILDTVRAFANQL